MLVLIPGVRDTESLLVAVGLTSRETVAGGSEASKVVWSLWTRCLDGHGSCQQQQTPEKKKQFKAHLHCLRIRVDSPLIRGYWIGAERYSAGTESKGRSAFEFDDASLTWSFDKWL